MFISAYKVLPLGNTVSVRTISPSNWVIILLRISLNCLVVLPRVQIAGQRPVWNHRPTLSFDGQALVHSSGTAAIQFYHIGCVRHEICRQHRETQAEPTSTNNKLGCAVQRYIWRSAGWMLGRLICWNIANTMLWEGPYGSPSFFWNEEIILMASIHSNITNVA